MTSGVLVVGLVLAPSAQAYTGTSFYAGYLKPGTHGTWCFHESDYYGYGGPVAVTATAAEYYDYLSTVATTIVDTTGQGWIYCTTIQNNGRTGTGVTINQRDQLAVNGSIADATFGEGYMPPKGEQTYCFQDNHQNDGPIVVLARPQVDTTTYGRNMTLQTVSTSLENRQGYGWTYCATVLNTSNIGALILLDVDFHPTGAMTNNRYVGYLNPGQQTTWCEPYASSDVPFIANAAASEYNAELETISTGRSSRPSDGWYCATIKNDSTIGTGVTLETKGGL